MAWLGEGFSSLKGQITNFTKEVLSDGKEDGSDETDETTLQKKILELETYCASQDFEICELRERNEQLQASLRDEKTKGGAAEISGNEGPADSWSSWDQPGFRTQYEAVPLEADASTTQKENSDGKEQYLKDQLNHLKAENNLMKRTCSELEDQVAELSEQLNGVRSKIHDSKPPEKMGADIQKTPLEAQLRGQLQAADRRVREMEAQLEQAQQQLLDQLTESQSSAHRVRSDLEQTRSQLMPEKSPGTAEAQRAKQDIANRILQIVEKRREVESNLKTLQSKGKHIATSITAVIQKLGDAEQQEFIHGALNALELENQVLRLRNAELEMCTESLKGYGFDLDIDYKVDHFGDDDSRSSSSLATSGLQEMQKQAEDASVSPTTASMCAEHDQLLVDKQSLTCKLEAMEATIKDLEAKMATMVEENVALSSNLEELDQQHQLVIDQLLAGKKTLLKENEALNLELANLQHKEMLPKKTSVGIGTDCSLNLESDKPSTSEDQYKGYKKIFDKELTEKIIHLVPFDLPQEHNNNDEELKCTCAIKALIKICEESKWKKDTLERKVAEVMKEVREVQAVLEDREEKISRLEEVNDSFKINEEALIEELMAAKSSNGEVLASIPENNEDVEMLEQRIAVLEQQLRDKAMLEAEVTSLREERAVVARRFQIAEASLDNEENFQICTGQELQEALLANTELRERCDALSNQVKTLEEMENNFKVVTEQYLMCKEVLDNKSFELDEAMSVNAKLEEDLVSRSDSLNQALLAYTELEDQNKAHLSTMQLQNDDLGKSCEECSRLKNILNAKEEQLQIATDSRARAESEVAELEDKFQQALVLKTQLDSECESWLSKIKAQEEEIKQHSDLQQEVFMMQHQLSMKQKELEDVVSNKSVLEANVAVLAERLTHADQETAIAAAKLQDVEDILQSKLNLESEIVEWKEKCMSLSNTENSIKTEMLGLVKTSKDLHQKIEAFANEKEQLLKQLADKEDHYNELMVTKTSTEQKYKEISDQLIAKGIEAESMQSAISLLQQQQEELIAAKIEAESEGVKQESSHHDLETARHEVEKWREMANASERQLDEAQQARATLEAECMRLFGIETKLHNQEHLEREVSRLDGAVVNSEQRLAEALEANEQLKQAFGLLEEQLGGKQSMEEEASEWREQCLLKERQLQDAASNRERIEAECLRLMSEIEKLEIAQSESVEWKKMFEDLQGQYDDLSKTNSALNVEFESMQKSLQLIPRMEVELNEWKEKLRVTEGQLNEVVMKKIELERECKNMECTLQDMKSDSNRDCFEKMDKEKPHHDDKNSMEKAKKDEEMKVSHEPSVQLEILQAEKEKILSVLDEKIRENGLLKTENNHLMQMISAEKIASNKLQEEKDETLMQHHMQSSETSLMAKQTVANLSEIIKNKDFEIEAFTHKCDALAKALEEEKVAASKQSSRLMTERDELIRTVQLKHQESLQYHAEIQRLSGLLNQELGRSEQIRLQYEDKQKILLNTQNELIAVKLRLDKLEQAASSQHLNFSSSTKSSNLVSQHIGVEDPALENKIEARSKEEEPLFERKDIVPLSEGIDCQSSVPLMSATSQDHRDVLIEELRGECSQLHDRIQQEATRNIYLQNEVQEQHEKESALLRELERLRLHLVAVEESYTLEAVTTEDQIRDLQGKLAQAEDRIKNCSTALTSASVRANQHVESLQGQTRLIGQQRDDIQAKLSAAEDQIQRHVAALTNLQAVLEQFQRDKEREIVSAKARLQRELQSAEGRQAELLAEAASLKAQLVEAKEGLSAAARLGEQLDKKTQVIAELKEEVTRLQTHLNTAEKREESASLNAEGKIDRYLVKNLVLGYLSTPANTKPQALRILGTVLDFNLEERGRAGLEPGVSPGGGWLQSLLHPGSGIASNQSISEAFIRFLESESRPQPQLRLLPTIQETQEKGKSDSPVPSGRSPSLLTDVQLPTFTQFPVPRSSSSILKDVLKDS